METARIILLVLIGGAALCLFYGFFLEPRWIRTRRIEVRFPRSYSPLPCAGKRIVYFSDIHTGASTTKRQLERAARAIRRAQPDILLFGGDLAEERTPVGNEAFRRMVQSSLASLEAPSGKWAILGNHDVEAPRYRAWSTSLLAGAGFTILENRGTEIDGLSLWGFEDALHGSPSCDGCTAESPFALYLSHEPDWFPKKKPAPGPGIVLSGHSHHGQVTFFGLPLIRPPMGAVHWKGFYRLGGHLTQIVSAGLGTVHIHARFFARPDIVVITFAHHKTKDTAIDIFEKRFFPGH